VVASGIESGVPWRIEAGPNIACPRDDAACAVTTALVWSEDGTERSTGALPPIGGNSLNALSQRIGDATVSFGTASSDVRSIEIETTDGQTVTPGAVPWPSPLQAFASPTAPIDGTIWWAVVPGVSSVEAVRDDGTTVPGGPAAVSGVAPAGTTAEVGGLRLDTTRDGDGLVATTELFGRPTVIRSGPDGVLVEIEGEDPVSYQTTLDTGYRSDIAGGSLVLWHEGGGGGPLTVEVDGTDETLVGRWIPFEDAAGGSGRLWILGLPGVGSGLERHGPDDLASAISWPVERDPAAGVVVAGGDNGEGVTWKIAYADPGCLVAARVDGDPSIGQTDCLTPVSDAPLVAHAIGERRSLLAIVIPGDVHGIYAGDLDAPSIYGQCVQPDRDPAWDGLSVCVVLVPNGRTVELQATTLGPGEQDETPFGDPIAVRVEDGRLVLEG
jgi:hypothetical protein